MKKYTLLVISWLLAANYSTTAQVVGTSAFLQGAYLEIGMLGNGSFGVPSSPLTYHSHTTSGSTTASPGGPLGEVYDIGHDGWTVGTPAFMGDYTYPGTPYEGWEIQVGAGRGQAFQQSGTAFASSGLTLSGVISSYSNTGGHAIANWVGTTGGLMIKTENKVDTNASWIVMTVKLYNTGASAIPGIYYLRTCEPDLDATWPGGSFSSADTITFQDDALHRVLVSSKAALPNVYLGLGTVDSRAKAFTYHNWPLPLTLHIDSIWAETYRDAGTCYAVDSGRVGDGALGLIFNIGTIPAGDSASFSYAYIFNNPGGLDSAFGISSLQITPTPGANSITLYPNPATDELTIKEEHGAYQSFTITNNIGQVMMTQPITAAQTTVNIKSLPSGVYYVMLKGPNGAQVEKLVKW